MRTEEFDEEWDPRICRVAARMRRSAYQYVRHFFISGAAMITMAFIAMTSKTMTLVLSILISFAIFVWIFFLVVAWSTYSIRMRRAGRLAYEYLGQPSQLRKGFFPPVMLVDIGHPTSQRTW